jgi:hypothetical protein
VFTNGFSGICATNKPHLCITLGMMPTRLQYDYEAMSVPAFVQQLAVSLVANGYRFYVTGRIPPEKDAAAVDRKIIERHGIAMSKWTRSRRKAAGLASVQYIRHGRFFVLIATEGEHSFFELEPQFRDVRRCPIKCFGYSIGCKLGRDRKWHPSVRISKEEYRRIKAGLVSIATRHEVAELAHAFASLPFEPYQPVVRQFFSMLRAVNRARKAAGAELVPVTALRLWRRPVCVFQDRPEGLPVAD